MTEDSQEIIERCKKAIAGWYGYFSPNITLFKRDRAFSFGQQWDPQVLFEYTNAKKPTLVIDLINPYLKKMIGEQRRGEIYPNILPTSTNVPQDQVDFLCSIVKQILYNSRAKEEFSRAYETMLRGGFAEIKMYTDYESNTSFNQQIFLMNMADPLCVFHDPVSNRFDFTDGACSGDFELMSKHEFEMKWPGIPFTHGENIMPAYAPYYLPALNTETAVVVNYYERKTMKKTLIQLTNGIDFKEEIFLEDEKECKRKYYQRYENEGYSLDMIPPLFESNRRSSNEDIIKAYKLTNNTILEETIWPSKYLPHLFLCADAIIADGQLLTRSFVSTARDAQRMYNFAVSEICASLKSSRRTQLMMTPDQIEGHEDLYKNIQNLNGALLWNPDPRSPGVPFQLSPPEVSQSFFVTAQQSSSDITKTLGMLDPITGELPDGTSGVALKRTISQQNLIVVNNIQNLEKIIEQAGIIILDLLPKIYDSERNFMYKNNNENKEIVLNEYKYGALNNDIKELTKIVSEFRVEGTASYSIQSQDLVDSLYKMIQVYPQTAPLVIDLLGKQIENPEASELERRLKYLVPEWVLQGETAPPPQPNPEIALKQQELQLKADHIQNQSQQDKLSLMIQHIQAQQEIEKSKMDNVTKLLTQQMKSQAEIHKALLEVKNLNNP